MINIYSEYNKVRDEIADLESQLKIKKETKQQLEASIIEDITAQGATSIVKEGYNYIVTIDKKYPKIIDKNEMVNWMIMQEQHELLTVNHRTLGRFIKDTGEIPTGVQITEEISLQRRKK